MRISRFKNEQYIPQLFTRNLDPVPLKCVIGSGVGMAFQFVFFCF